MKQIKPWGDMRTLLGCTFCGSFSDTRDHCPSKVLLDKPYAENLPVVPACSECNNSFSKDEEYLACFIEASICNSVQIDELNREPVKKIFKQSPKLQQRILESATDDGRYQVELVRAKSIMQKLSQGHILFELNEKNFECPIEHILFWSPAVSEQFLEEFETPSESIILPELGSRAFQKALIVNNNMTNFHAFHDWQVVQGGQYRYYVSCSPCIEVRIVISEKFCSWAKW